MIGLSSCADSGGITSALGGFKKSPPPVIGERGIGDLRLTFRPGLGKHTTYAGFPFIPNFAASSHRGKSDGLSIQAIKNPEIWLHDFTPVLVDDLSTGSMPEC